MGLEASGVCPRGPGWVVGPYGGPGEIGSPPVGLGGVGRTPRCPGSSHRGIGGVGRPTWRSEGDWKSNPEVLEGSESLAKDPGEIGRHSRRNG